MFPKSVILKRENNSAKFSSRKKAFIQVGALRRPSYLSEALRLPKKLDLQRTPLQKKCRHVGNHVIFPSIYKVLHQRTLGCGLNHHWTRVSLSTNQYRFPVEFMIGGLLHLSVKRPLVSSRGT